MSIEDAITQIREDLNKGSFKNEAAVSNGAVLPILQALGGPVFTTSVVSPQYPITQLHQESKKWVDFALCKPNEGPVVLVEVKMVGKATTGEQQLFEYAFHSGIPFVVLTDGQEWDFYLPSGTGSYGDRRVYRLDILEREVEESRFRLERYLSFNSVLIGKSYENVQADYQALIRKGQFQKNLPVAWKILLEEADDSLVESLAVKVEDLCGFKPDAQVCAEFLATILQQDTGDPPPPPPPPSGPLGFVLHGNAFQYQTIKEVVINVFEKLYEQDTSFPEKFASVKHGSKRRYLAINKSELFPDRPDLCEQYGATSSFGWFIATNHGKASATKAIQLACQVSGLEVGKDFVLRLD